MHPSLVFLTVKLVKLINVLKVFQESMWRGCMWHRGVGGLPIRNVMEEDYAVWTWNLWNADPSGSISAPWKLESRQLKEGGNLGPIQRGCMGAGARGQKPFNFPQDMGTRITPPSFSPDLCELDPDEQCKEGEGEKKERTERKHGEDNSLENKRGLT